MILITGGAGYIGSHTCVSLAKAGHEFVVIDSLVNSSLSSVQGIEAIIGKPIKFLQGDIRDENFLASVFTSHKITQVVHFAGLKSVGESNSDPLQYYDCNVTGTLTLLKVMAANCCRSIVFSSSATVYGYPEMVPVIEDSPLCAINPYGQTKLIIENILNDLRASDKRWEIVILRYFNPAGAHESGLIGEAPNNAPTNLFPIVSNVAAGHRSHLDVFGGDYKTHDGTGVRDYIHVTDLADGHVSALNILSKKHGILTINLGTGIGYSVLEIIKEFEKISNTSISYSIVDRRSGDSAICYADPSYASEILGWTTKYNLTKMCQDQWRWQKNLDKKL